MEWLPAVYGIRKAAVRGPFSAVSSIFSCFEYVQMLSSRHDSNQSINLSEGVVSASVIAYW